MSAKSVNHEDFDQICPQDFEVILNTRMYKWMNSTRNLTFSAAEDNHL